MNYLNVNPFTLLARHGVLHRGEFTNCRPSLQRLLKKRYVKKAHLHGKVYYQLTENALPLLDDYRNKQLYSVLIQTKLQPRARVYQAMLGDLRFLDEKNAEAQKYMFLGDWQLRRKVTAAQLELAQQRYFEAVSKNR